MNLELLHWKNAVPIAVMALIFIAAVRWAATYAGYNLPNL